MALGSFGAAGARSANHIASPLFSLAGAIRRSMRGAAKLRDKAGDRPSRREFLSAFMRTAVTKLAA